MYEVISLWILAVVYIVFAVIQDFKTREIPNWLNFSLLIFALGFRFFYSLFNVNFSFFYSGVIGLIVFSLIGNIFYYGKIFAGGDAKLMISLGAILPLNISILENLQYFFNFLLIFLFAGFFYIIFASLFLVLKNFKNFKKEFIKKIKKNKKILNILLFVSVGLLLIGFFEPLFFILGIFLFFFTYLYLYSKSIDETCMIKKINSKYLTEGDWLYKDLRLGNKIIKSNWEGLSKKEIKEIKKKYDFVKIKQGVPFSPTFLISFIIFIIMFLLKINLWNSFWNP